jgi:hypothetical protein
MLASTFRQMSVEKMIVIMERDCGSVDLPKYGMKKIDHHLKRANKLANVYRQGRRNFMYSK